MSIKAYRLELFVLISMVFALGAYGFKEYRKARSQHASTITAVQIAQIQEAKALSDIWGAKGIKKRLQRIKKTLPDTVVKTWKVEGKKIQVTLQGLDSNSLDGVLGRFLSLPLRIESLKILRSGQVYHLECLCKR